MSIKRTQDVLQNLVQQVALLPPDKLNALAALLQTYTVANRYQTVLNLLRQKNSYCTFILEDLFQQQNLSAIVRTAECMGLLDLHIIESGNRYITNKQIVKGADRWLHIWQYTNLEFENPLLACVLKLKKEGYKIWVASPQKSSCAIDEMPLDSPIAVLLGTEKTGHTALAQQLADGFVHIPMFGATESLNVSVSAGIMMHQITSNLRSNPPTLYQNYQANLLDEVLFLIRSRKVLQATTEVFLKNNTVL